MAHEELKAMTPLTDAEKKMAFNNLKVLYIKLNGMLEGVKKDLKA